MYKPYLSVEEYKEKGGLIDNAEKYLLSASRHIDILTFNRIIGRGFDMANFEYENEDLLNSVFQSYSINGVSMQFGNNMNVSVKGGVAVKNDTYNLLMQTGLCYRGLK